MSDYLPPVVARLVADTDEHDRKINRSADVWEDSARQIRAASRGVAQQSSGDSAQAASVWERASARMSRSSRRSASDAQQASNDSGQAARESGQSWTSTAATITRSIASTAASVLAFKMAGVNLAQGFQVGAATQIKFAARVLATGSALGFAAAAAAGLIAALPALASGLAGIASVGIGAFSGIGAALKGYAADQQAAATAGGASASAAAASARAIRDASKQIATAHRNAARTARDGQESIQAAAERVTDALRAEARAAKAVGDALRDQARVARDGAESIIAAQRRQASSIQDLRRAEAGMEKARQQAIRTLAELNERVSDLALDQEGAAIGLAKAEKAYYRELRSSEATELSRREALYDLNVAKERQSDLEREATETVAEATEANAKGVEGSDEYLDAKERLADATEAAAEAERDEARAREDAAEANEDAAERVADAREAQGDAARSTADAERDLMRAQRDAQEANEDAARQVADAVQGLADAQAQAAESASAGAAASSKYADAMAKLTPAGRAFVEQLIAMEPLVKGLRDAAQESFLPGLTQMLRDSEGLFPIFEENIRLVGEQMGRTAEKFGTMFKSDKFRENLDQMQKNALPIVEALGDGVLALVDAWVELGANQEITQGAADLLTGAFTGLSEFLLLLDEHGDSFGRVLSALGEILEILTPAVADLAGEFAGYLAPILEYFVSLLERNRDDLGGWIKDLVGLYLAFKVFRTVAKWGMILSFASTLLGLIPGMDRIAGRLRGISGLMRGVGIGGAAVAGLALADEFLPEATPEQEAQNQGNGLGYAGLKNITGAANQAVTDPAAALRDIKAELDLVAQTWAAGQTPIQQYWGTFQTWIGRLPADVGGWFSGMWTTAGLWLDQQKVQVETKTAEAYNSVVTWFGALPGKVGEFFGGMWLNAKTWSDNLVRDVAVWAQGIVDGFVRWLQSLPGEADRWFRDAKDGAIRRGQELLNWARDLPGQFLRMITGTSLFQSGVSLVSGWWDGIVSRWNQMTTWVRQGMANLRALWPFSPAKTGPFSGTGYVTYSGAALTGDFAKSIAAGTPGIIASARAAMEGAKSELTGTARISNLAGSPGGRATGLIDRPGTSGQVVNNYRYEIAGTVVAERELLALVQTGASKFEKRNTTNGLGGGRP